MDKLLNTEQAAKTLGVSARRVRALIEHGRLIARRIGRDWLISESDLAHIKRGRQPKGK